MFDGGHRLKSARLDRSLTCRDVAHFSRVLADILRDDRYIVSISTLSSIENHRTIPGIFRLASLCLIYELDLSKVLMWFGVEVGFPKRSLFEQHAAVLRGEKQSKLIRHSLKQR
jgi:transcriptional regulator with XRE-family HTH domain